MQLISYVSRQFANVSAVFDYLAANVPWLTVSGDALTADNLTLEKSAMTAIKITDSVNGTNMTTSIVSSSNDTFNILITDTAFIVGQKITGAAPTAFIIGKSTDGTNEHYGVISRSSGSTPAETMLTYGDLTAGSRASRSVLQSAYNSQLIPVYSETNAYNIENAFLTFMSNQPAYYGKITLDGNSYVQCGGLALQYTE